ncbi:MAG: MoxR family ATPase [Planctomycetia bacterium]|nr:MoxR family ATPase [Planctomycetia bacterium]
MKSQINIKDIQTLITKLEDNISLAFFGKKEVIRLSLTALFSGEHLLLEDVPGVGKTMLARTIAKSLDLTFRRIQFTPDLIPADITGGSIFNPKTQEFNFSPGPIFTNILLADEINRTTPRTQSAMLEAMSERQVSCDGNSYPIPKPFMVIATENPMEYEGTYPLPESQLDRFLLRISIGYPNRNDEMDILKSHQLSQPIDQISSVLCNEDVQLIQNMVKTIKIDDAIRHYVLALIEATRNSSELFAGVSPRGGIAFCRALQAFALLNGRSFVIPDDVKSLAVPILAHRVIPKSLGLDNQREVVETLIERLLNNVPIPAGC